MRRTIRPSPSASRVDDIPAILQLSSRIWREHYPGIFSYKLIDYMPGKMYAADIIRGEIENKGYRCVLVMQSNAAVGYLAYRRDDKRRSVMISKLYLLPSLHGKSIGGQMLRTVKDDALPMGGKTVSLSVNKNNRSAINAYERFEFVKAEMVITEIGGGFVMDDYRVELAF